MAIHPFIHLRSDICVPEPSRWREDYAGETGSGVARYHGQGRKKVESPRVSPSGSGGETNTKICAKIFARIIARIDASTNTCSGPRSARNQRNDNYCESLRETRRDIRCERHLKLPCPRLVFMSRNTQSSRKSLRESSRWCCRMRNSKVKTVPPMSSRSRDGSTR
jgi:hypothetical protein